MPIYTLLELFDLEAHVVLLTKREQKQCGFGNKNFPFLVAQQKDVVVERDLKLFAKENEARVVCARNMVGGMAWLTDHGINRHGALETDFSQPENIGRGPQFSRFRDHVLRNTNITLLDLRSTTVPRKLLKVVFSIFSSYQPVRRRNFTEEMAGVAQKFGPKIDVQAIAMWNHTILQQIELVSQSSIYVSVAGGGAFPAYFLPKGASLILYASRKRGMLDWDLWNNYRDVHVHWLDLDSHDVDVLVKLVGAELHRIESGFL